MGCPGPWRQGGAWCGWPECVDVVDDGYVFSYVVREGEFLPPRFPRDKDICRGTLLTHFISQLTGLLVALMGLYITYIVPRFVPAVRGIAGLPGL